MNQEDIVGIYRSNESSKDMMIDQLVKKYDHGDFFTVVLFGINEENWRVGIDARDKTTAYVATRLDFNGDKLTEEIKKVGIAIVPTIQMANTLEALLGGTESCFVIPL